MGEQGKAGFYKMSMFTFSGAILLMCMRTRHTVQDPKLIKERVEVVVFTPPIGLNMKNFVLKKTLNMCLKLNKNVEHIRFAFNKIKPGEPTVSINKADIVIMATNRRLGMTPYIRKHKLKRMFNHTTRL
jgi:20S proteasome alpha/beta subunit